MNYDNPVPQVFQYEPEEPPTWVQVCEDEDIFLTDPKTGSTMGGTAAENVGRGVLYAEGKT